MLGSVGASFSDWTNNYLVIDLLQILQCINIVISWSVLFQYLAFLLPQYMFTGVLFFVIQFEIGNLGNYGY